MKTENFDVQRPDGCTNANPPLIYLAVAQSEELQKQGRETVEIAIRTTGATNQRRRPDNQLFRKS